MSRARRSRIVGVLMASMLCGFVALTACSNAGEGERCQAENGNDDCQSPLVCLAGGQKAFNGGVGLVNPPYNDNGNTDRCCPLDRAKASHPACVLLSTSGASDGSAPDGETGPVPDATPDTAADTSTIPDAADAASDAEGG